MSKNQHVVPKGKEWAVRGEGNERLTAIAPTQREAIDRAREIAIREKSEVVIHDRRGQIRDKDSYGKDPCPPRDRKH